MPHVNVVPNGRRAGSATPCRGSLCAIACIVAVLATSRGARAQEAPPEPARGPIFKLGGEAGLLYWCEHGPWGPNNGVGHAMNPGFDAAFRASLELQRWFAIDARLYLAYASAKSDVAGNAGFLTVGGFAGVRFTLPLEGVHPYVVFGPGVYGTSVTGSGPTPLYGATAPAIAGGLGVEIPVSGRVSVGAEYLFHYQIGEKYSDDPNIEGGDPVTLNVFAQVAL
jgi:hypothetical protein